MDWPVFFPTRIGERASASHAHWLLHFFMYRYPPKFVTNDQLTSSIMGEKNQKG